MKRLIAGGVRKKKTNRGIPVPVNARLNKFGNLSRNYLKNKVESPRSFIATIKGTEGIWETRGRGKNKSLRLLVSFKDRTTYPGGSSRSRRSSRIASKRRFRGTFKRLLKMQSSPDKWHGSFCFVICAGYALESNKFLATEI